MVDHTRPRRSWLAVAYTLATVLVYCAHHHGRGRDDHPTRCTADCEDARVRLSGHAAADPGHFHADCAACQFRAEHHAGRADGPEPSRLLCVGGVDAPGPLLTSPGASLRPTCRAPPRA